MVGMVMMTLKCVPSAFPALLRGKMPMIKVGSEVSRAGTVVLRGCPSRKTKHRPDPCPSSLGDAGIRLRSRMGAVTSRIRGCLPARFIL